MWLEIEFETFFLLEGCSVIWGISVWLPSRHIPILCMLSFHPILKRMEKRENFKREILRTMGKATELIENSAEYFFNHNNYRKFVVKGCMIYKLTVRKRDRPRNRTWDLPITIAVFCYLSYLGMIILQAHSRNIRAELSSHAVCSRLERWEREKYLKPWKTPQN